MSPGKDWGQEEKGTTEDEMAGWYHQLDGHEFEWTPGDGDGQGSLACCNSWGPKESDTNERLSWTELNVSMDFSLQWIRSKLMGTIKSALSNLLTPFLQVISFLDAFWDFLFVPSESLGIKPLLTCEMHDKTKTPNNN